MPLATQPPNERPIANGDGKPPRGPLRRDRFHAAIERGDFAQVLDMLVHDPPMQLVRGEGLAALTKAIDCASKRSASSFSKKVLRQTISFCVTVQLRLQLQALRAIEKADDAGNMPKELDTEIWPQLRELIPLMAELLRTQAATARLWALTRRTRGDTCSLPRRQRQLQPQLDGDDDDDLFA